MSTLTQDLNQLQGKTDHSGSSRATTKKYSKPSGIIICGRHQVKKVKVMQSKKNKKNNQRR